MKPFLRLIPLALLLGGCATAAAPVTAPEPVPVPAEPATPPQPEVVPTTTPERWWLLDPEAERIYGAGVDRAYGELLRNRQPAREVVVAIIDSGVDIEHEDLDDVLWVNSDEVPGNGRDDDSNGYIDDVHGWNFIGGPDGRHVEEDTYEVTRLVAACRRLYGDMPRTPPPVERPAQADCPAIEAAWQEMRQENEQMLMQLRQLNAAVDQIVGILKRQLGDSLTADRVRSMTATANDVRQAQQMYLQLAANNITPQMIDDEVERIEKLLEMGLNPAFDPRSIVGDDYADKTERVYGNPDVTGPDASHGTGVAGIVGAERNNEQGVDGIANSVRIMPIRAVPDGDERDKDVANAIRYAVDNGAHIINMSFGKAWSPDKGVVDAAVKYADERGVLLIHAAGNDAKDLATEKNFPNDTYLSGGVAQHWIEVGSSSWRGLASLASEFSNFGREQVDIFAPGSDVLSTSPGDEYESASGTSFAAPVVTGVAALIMAHYPSLSAADVRRILMESATPLREQMVVRPGEEEMRVRFGDLSVTGGVVNAYRALQMAEQMSRPRS